MLRISVLKFVAMSRTTSVRANFFADAIYRRGKRRRFPSLSRRFRFFLMNFFRFCCAALCASAFTLSAVSAAPSSTVSQSIAAKAEASASSKAAPAAKAPVVSKATAAGATAKPEPRFSDAVNARTTLKKAPPRAASTRSATKKSSWLPATIVIPALGVRAPLVRGVDTPALRYGVGYDPDSDAVGARGNAVIAGHRNIWGSYFWYLPRLQRGDTVMIEAQQKQYFYRVESSRVVQPHETHVLDAAPSSPAARLTLYTCTKPKTECRFIVSAKLYRTLDISRQPEKSLAVAVPKRPTNKRTPPPLPKWSASTRNALPTPKAKAASAPVATTKKSAPSTSVKQSVDAPRKDAKSAP